MRVVQAFLICNGCAALLTVLLLLMRALLSRRISVRLRYYSWFALLFVLLLPLVPADLWKGCFSAISHQAVAGLAAPSTAEGTAAAVTLWMEDITELGYSVQPDWLKHLLTWFWAAGVLVAAIFYWLGLRELRRTVKTGVPPSAEQLELLQRCRQKCSVTRPVQLCASALVSSPLSFRLRACYIVLPAGFAAQSTGEALEQIFLHELMHIRHRDLTVNTVCCFLQTLYWWNPFVWYAFGQMRQDRELYCDWAVLALLPDQDQRLRYGTMLLQFARRQSKQQSLTAVSSLCDHRTSLKQRITYIADFQLETAAQRRTGFCLMAVLLLLSLLPVPALAAGAELSADWYRPPALNLVEQDYSQAFGPFSGCAVIYDLQQDCYLVYHPEKMTRRLAPCSTCKIFSALYALEQGSISAEQNLLSWDGQQYPFAAWNQDQTFVSAMRYSVNWYFERLDQMAGSEDLQAFYRQIGYGNGMVGADAARYWDGSALKISPLEQVQVLTRFYQNDLGCSVACTDTVKNALLLQETEGVRLYGKTGTGRTDGRDVLGWFVGFVETAENTYCFAICLQNDAQATGAAAMQTAGAIFASMGII